MKTRITWDDLPLEIRLEMITEQVKQGCVHDSNVFRRNLTAGIGSGGFNWEKSVKGRTYWESVINKNKELDNFEELLNIIEKL